MNTTNGTIDGRRMLRRLMIASTIGYAVAGVFGFLALFFGRHSTTQIVFPVM
jgi:hypothetical protein